MTISEEPSDQVDDVLLSPAGADPQSIIEKKIPLDIRQRYEVHSYKNAAVILSEVWPDEFKEICDALRKFTITKTVLKKAGGNESEIPKIFSKELRPLGWNETTIQGDLHVRLNWREPIVGAKPNKKGKVKTASKSDVSVKEKFIDGHKIDYVKGRVAFDLEWNSKDQTFDRDLYAFNAFFLAGAINCAVLVTRSLSMNEIFKAEKI